MDSARNHYHSIGAAPLNAAVGRPFLFDTLDYTDHTIASSRLPPTPEVRIQNVRAVRDDRDSDGGGQHFRALVWKRASHLAAARLSTNTFDVARRGTVIERSIHSRVCRSPWLWTE